MLLREPSSNSGFQGGYFWLILPRCPDGEVQEPTSRSQFAGSAQRRKGFGGLPSKLKSGIGLRSKLSSTALSVERAMFSEVVVHRWQGKINLAVGGAAIPTPVPALLATGRSGSALSLAPSGSVDWPALYGQVSRTVRAAEFWAKAVTASTVNASTGATDLGFVALIADGAWHRYVLPFPTDVPTGSPVVVFVAAVGAGPNLPVIFDSLKLVARPFETVLLVSNNGFQGASVVTATVSGLWSSDPHFMSAMRTSDGGEACSGCLHVLVPALSVSVK
jgi:hypothetical protein